MSSRRARGYRWNEAAVVRPGGRGTEEFDRISQQPEIMGGKACIRGMLVTVGMIVGQIGAGHSVDELLADYPYLERSVQRWTS
jgi:uncharacterized protein (DUF433 family)